MLWSPLFDWSFEPVPVVGTATAVYLYWRGRRTASSALGRAASWDRGDTYFALGLTALVLALVSPIAYFDVSLQWDHMLQHVLLLLVAPPLILMGDPFRTAWAGYLAAQGRPIAIADTRVARVMRGVHSGPRPATLVVALFSANLLFWHIPSVYDDTLRIASVHDLEHMTFLVLGLLFWDQVISPLEVPGRLSLIGRAGVVLVGMGVSWALAVAIAYASHPLYAYPAPTGGLTLLADQQIAAGVMWVPGSAPLVIALLCLGICWFDVTDRGAPSVAAAPR